ncbi:MAG TPA: lysophospholipid acyltransferase family protein [Gemmatimonadales bacterium]|nr:lysophospholipid acyltransferase family protein [Gemmatimonadales bacterium]
MKLALAPRTAALLGAPLLSLLARSWRIETVREERWRTLLEAGRPHVFLLWHDALLPLLWHHRGRGVTIVVSEAQDGRYLAAYARRIGYREARGSSTRGGVRALVGAMKALQAGTPVAFTPDGPRGPRREFKGGVLLAAQRSGAVVVPLHAGADRAWRLRSWDRFLVPKPLARVRIAYGPTFEVAPGPDGLAAGQRLAETGLAEAVREVEWDDGATPTG